MENSDLNRQIRNARRRLGRLQEQRSSGSEAREAFENAPLAQGAMAIVELLDKKIKEEEDLISRLLKKREKESEKA